MCLTALVLASFYYYGYRALCVVGISVATCYATDLLCIYLRKEKYIFKNISPIIIGIVYALLMPASISFPLLITSCVVMIAIGKQVFGGIDNPIFQPVAVGYAISSICWSASILMYTKPVPLSQLPLVSQITQPHYHSLTFFLNQGAIPFVSNTDIMLGRFDGPMGTTHIAILAMCAIVLMLRKIVPFQTVLTAIAVICGGAYLFPNSIMLSTTQSIMFDLVSGSALFILLFIACDKSLLPKTSTGKTLYGIIIGLLTIIFRKYALVDQGMIFAVIIANVLVSTLDAMHPLILNLFKSMKTWPKKFVSLIIFIFKSLIKLIVFLAKKFVAFIKFIAKKLSQKPQEIKAEEAIEEVAEAQETEVVEVVEEVAEAQETEQIEEVLVEEKSDEPEQTQIIETPKSVEKPKRKRNSKKPKQKTVEEIPAQIEVDTTIIEEKPAEVETPQPVEVQAPKQVAKKKKTSSAKKPQEIKIAKIEEITEVKEATQMKETTEEIKPSIPTKREISIEVILQNQPKPKSRKKAQKPNAVSKGEVTQEEINAILEDTPKPIKRGNKKKKPEVAEEKVLVSTSQREDK